MNCPPLVMRLAVCQPKPDRQPFVFWLPIFLAWLVLAAILIALSPIFLLLAMVAFFFGWGRAVLLFIPLVAGCICALRGLEVNVERKDKVIFISFK